MKRSDELKAHIQMVKQLERLLKSEWDDRLAQIIRRIDELDTELKEIEDGKREDPDITL